MPNGETFQMFDLQHRWLGPFSTAAVSMFRFQCPEELLPLRPTKAVLSLKLNAPSRKVEIIGLEGGRVISLGERQSPLGTVQFEIDRPEALRLDPQGGLRLGIRVGPSRARPRRASAARLEDRGHAVGSDGRNR